MRNDLTIHHMVAARWRSDEIRRVRALENRAPGRLRRFDRQFDEQGREIYHGDHAIDEQNDQAHCESREERCEIGRLRALGASLRKTGAALGRPNRLCPIRNRRPSHKKAARRSSPDRFALPERRR
jgi:hypothetical protein